MGLYDDVFNLANIYDTLFFNIKAVLMYSNLEDFKTHDLNLYNRWEYISKSKYRVDLEDESICLERKEDIYEEKAIYYPEFTKIVAITYGSLQNEDGKLVRFLKKINHDDESMIISDFMKILSDYHITNLTFSGHNIINYDIPLLIKRFIFNLDKIENNKLPLPLKRALNAKPWESSLIIDTVNVWRFNGNNYSPLMLISDFLNLKKNDNLHSLADVSRNYWELFSKDPVKANQYTSLQSAIQTNLVMQLLYRLRDL